MTDTNIRGSIKTNTHKKSKRKFRIMKSMILPVKLFRSKYY